MLIRMDTTTRTPLEMGYSDLSMGGYSVGLAPTRTCEQLVEAYLELVTLVRRDRPEYIRDEDIVALAGVTKFDIEYLRNRVEQHLASLGAHA